MGEEQKEVKGFVLVVQSTEKGLRAYCYNLTSEQLGKFWKWKQETLTR